jgi:hypothetical protein
MTGAEFLVALALGAGALALWIHVRFPGITPESWRQALIHVGIALVVGQALFPALSSLIPSVNPVARALVVIFALGLPILTYSLLSSIWIIRALQGALRR